MIGLENNQDSSTLSLRISIEYPQDAEETLVADCSKTLRYKATDNLYPPPAGRGVSPAESCGTQRRGVSTRLRREGNAVDGRFSATC